MSSKNTFYIENYQIRSNINIHELINVNPVILGTLRAPIAQPDCSIAIGNNAGYWHQGDCAIAMGENSGHTSQGDDSIALGSYAGNFFQGTQSIAIGFESGRISQGLGNVAMGSGAGEYNQKNYGVAIGYQSGRYRQGTHSIAIGNESGGAQQQFGGIAIGSGAGFTNQGSYSIAIGFDAGRNNQSSNSIILNASGNELTSNTASLYVDPIRRGIAPFGLFYNSSTKEIVYDTASSTPFLNGTYHGDYLFWNEVTDSWEVGSNEIHLGKYAGLTEQSFGAIAIGNQAGVIGQGTCAIAIGCDAGGMVQGAYSIAIGSNAGAANQQPHSIILNASGMNSILATTESLYVDPIRIEESSMSYGLFYHTDTKEVVYRLVNGGGGGNVPTPESETGGSSGTNHSNYLFWDSYTLSWAIGSGEVHLGDGAGQTNQSSGAIAIGVQAGYANQGTNAIAIGRYAGGFNQSENSIVLNATGNALGAPHSGLFIDPIRVKDTLISYGLFYDPMTKEVVYGLTDGGGGGGSGLPVPPSSSTENHSNYLFWDSYTLSWKIGSTEIHLGDGAGQTGQSTGAIALGNFAGHANQGEHAIAIGKYSGMTNQSTNSIILNASGNALTATQPGLFVSPIRGVDDVSGSLMIYDSNSSEVKYTTASLDVNILLTQINILQTQVEDLTSTVESQGVDLSKLWQIVNALTGES